MIQVEKFINITRNGNSFDKDGRAFLLFRKLKWAINCATSLLRSTLKLWTIENCVHFIITLTWSCFLKPFVFVFNYFGYKYRCKVNKRCYRRVPVIFIWDLKTGWILKSLMNIGTLLYLTVLHVYTCNQSYCYKLRNCI